MRYPSGMTSIRFLVLLFVLAAWMVGSGRAQNLELERDRALGMLDQVRAEVEKNFYDPALKGLDWKGLVGQTRQRIQGAKSPADMFVAIYVLLEKLDDSHTVFLPPRRVGSVRFGFEAKPYGEDVRIYEVKKGGAAERAGLRPGDRIHSVNKIPADRWSWDKAMIYVRVLRPVLDMDLLISRGEEAPRTVRVTAAYQTGKLEIDLSQAGIDVYDLIREAQTESKKFTYSMLDRKIGLLGIPYFTGNKGHLRDLVAEIDGSRAAIIDLRGNRGGSVEGLAYLAGMFEPKETVMAEMVGRKKSEPVKLKPSRPNLNVPLVILVDSECASACEAFARYFQRTGQGVVVGDQTSGYVSVARIFDKQMGTDSVVFYAAEVTVAQLVFPGGEQLEKKGVTPDHVCIPTEDDLREGRDPCRALALRIAREKLGPSAEPPKQ